MAFDHKLACDEIEEPSILVPTIVYKLPLLILTVLLKQSFVVDSSNQTELLAEEFFGGLAQTNSSSSSNNNNKWEPSLPTIDEEEKPSTTTRIDGDEKDHDNGATDLRSEGQRLQTSTSVATLWKQVLWSAEFLLSSKQKRAILDGFVAYLPIGVQ
jgi:hypothetical protein